MTKEKIEHYKKRLIRKMDALIEEINKDKEEFEKNYSKTHIKPDGYVLKENLTIFNEEIEAVNHFKNWIQSCDGSRVKDIEEFKKLVLDNLEKMYKELTRLRAGIRMIMETVKSTFI